ncbi:MAG: bifunctional oligoribonuclease/PAP phosphatase NrnA [bacterium]|jgi:phosphoesterase RecJ-like protein|nr:bifunctional oligoribonuclease/PAP phosphatase NrnA [bacterium]
MDFTTEFDSGTFAEVQAVIKAHQRFLVSSHTHADGDAVGAALAFKRMLEQMGKDVRWVMDEDPGETYEIFYSPEELEVYSSASDFSSCEVIVMVDAGEWHRLGAVGEVLQDHPGHKLCIDHHYPKNDFNGTRFLRVKSPSTTVIMYHLCKFLQLEWNLAIAEPIYLGIIVDTINFHLPHTTKETHLIAADCLDAGVLPARVYEPVFGTVSQARLQLMCDVFENLEILGDGKVATVYTTLAMMERAGASRNDDDRFVDLLRGLKGVRIGIYFREETDGTVKVSWRAKGDNNILISAQHFGGGGHMRAAGASIPGPMDKVRNQVLANILTRLSNGEFH